MNSGRGAAHPSESGMEPIQDQPSIDGFRGPPPRTVKRKVQCIGEVKSDCPTDDGLASETGISPRPAKLLPTLTPQCDCSRPSALTSPLNSPVPIHRPNDRDVSHDFNAGGTSYHSLFQTYLRRIPPSLCHNRPYSIR